MRKIVGICFAIVVFAELPLAVGLAAPAGAAAGTVCKSFSGTATFTPALPKLGSGSKVRSVLSGTGSIGSCTGSVSGGTVRFVSSASAPENCKIIATAPTAAIKATETISWAGAGSSTINIKFTEVPGNPVTTQSIAGTVSAGVFKGAHEKGKVMYTPLNGGCTSTGLSRIAFQASGPITIK